MSVSIASIAFGPPKYTCQGVSLTPSRKGLMYIRKRSHDLHLRLNDDELEKLNAAVAKTGLSREAYLRKLIAGQQPKELPPSDFRPMMRQLYYVGNNLNQIARKANALNVIDTQQYDATVKLFRQVVADIYQSIIGLEK